MGFRLTCRLGRLQTGTDPTSDAPKSSVSRFPTFESEGMTYVVRSEDLRLAASFQVAKTSSSIVSATQADFGRDMTTHRQGDDQPKL